MKDRIDSFFEYLSRNNFTMYGLLLAILIDEMVADDNVFCLSISRIAKKLKCSIATANRARKAHIEAGGLVEINETGLRGRKKYHVAFLSEKQSSLTNVKSNINQERKTKYFFCKKCGIYSQDRKKEFCECGDQFCLEVLIPENVQFEVWGKTRIEKPGDVFVIKNNN